MSGDLMIGGRPPAATGRCTCDGLMVKGSLHSSLRWLGSGSAEQPVRRGGRTRYAVEEWCCGRA
jgi:hypothetical protein